jgi:hypothetical protein
MKPSLEAFEGDALGKPGLDGVAGSRSQAVDAETRLLR